MRLKPLSCVFGKFYVPQHYILPFMIQFGIWNAYHFRVVLNIAMPEMRAPLNDTITVDACPGYKDEHVKNIGGGRYEWSSNQESLILGGFYGGYLITHIPGGWLADKIGARHVLGICVFGSAMLTLIFPVAVESQIFSTIILLRILTGLFQGPIYPCVSTFIQCWFPPSHRSLLGGIAYGGANLGPITGNIITGIIIQRTSSWKIPFYVWPSFGLLWYIFYLFMVFSRPDTHPFITNEELAHLKKDVPRKVKITVPWKAILKSPVTYALISGQFGHDFIFYAILTVLPKYMKDILKLNIQKNAVFSAIPFVFIWLSTIISSYIADYVINKALLSIVTVRRIWTAIGAIIPGILLVTVTYIGCNRTVALFLYSLVMLFKGFFFAGMKLNVNDVTFHFGGTIMAIANGVAAIAGLLGPTIVGLLTKNHSIEGWQIFMWSALVIQCVTTVIYWVFTSGERQSWDYTREDLEENEQ